MISLDHAVLAAGTVLTAFGLVVVAPRATGRAPGKGLGWVWRVVLRRGREATYHVAALDPMVSADSAVRRAVLTDDGPVIEQVAFLRCAIEGLRQEVDGLRDADRQLRTDLVERIATLEGEHRDLADQLRKQLAETELLNTRGFPLAATGTLIVGCPFLFASWWWAILWVPAISWALRLLWISRAPLITGWRDGWKEGVTKAPDLKALSPESPHAVDADG